MKTTLNKQATVRFKTSKETGQITLIRRSNENIAAISLAAINGIEFTFIMFIQQADKIGILVNCKELHKVLSYVPEIDKDVILQILDFKNLQDLYNRFSSTIYTNQKVESGLGFLILDTESNWKCINKYAHQFLTGEGMMNVDLVSDVFSKLKGFEVTTLIHPIFK